MMLPNAERATIAEAKLSGYLLDPDHKIGGPKYRFLARFGYRVGDSDRLRKALRNHLTTCPKEFIGSTEHGAKWMVRGRIDTPDGRNPYVTSVWQVDQGKVRPKFVTLTDLGGE